MRAALRLCDDELSADELQRLALEHPEIDEPLVLHAALVFRRERRLLAFYQSSFEASRAPSARLASFAHTMSGSTAA
jgi:hypothetical protein